MLEFSCALFEELSRYYRHQHYRVGKEKKKIKHECLRLFGMNARWFNTIRFSVDGQIAAAKESSNLAMDSLATALAE